MGKHNAYPEEVVEFIRENVSGKTAEELSVIVNEKFGTDFDKNKMKSFKQNHKIRSGREHLKGRKEETELFPKEIIAYIMQNYIGKGHAKMAKILNEKFGTKYTTMQIKAFYGNRKLDSGVTGYFESGHIPPNKGKKGFCAKGSEKGWFGKGHVPANKLPIGTILKKSDGYLWRKIGEGSRDWKQEHVIRWEEKNGAIPKGFCLTFLDGNRENVEISNLALVSRAEHVTLTKLNLRSEEPEITETGILIARLYTEKQKKKKKSEKMTVKEFNLMERQEETFERMAFKLEEERKLLIEGIKRMVDACEFCEFGEERPECDYADCDCLVCGCKDCVCRKCRNGSNFFFSPERAKKSLERFEGK